MILVMSLFLSCDPVGSSGLLSKQELFLGTDPWGWREEWTQGRLEPLPGLNLAPLLNS